MKSLLAIAILGVGLAAMAATVGTPHERRLVRCLGDRQGNCVFIEECQYVGVDGRWKLTPEMMPGWGCPRFMFFGFNGPVVVNHVEPLFGAGGGKPENVPASTTREAERRGY